MGDPGEATRLPREVFAERFALLYAEAGDPPLKAVVASVAGMRRAGQVPRNVRVSAQRVSDWRRGRNVPARFEALAAVLEALVGQARKARPRPVAEGLYDIDRWRTLWQLALASPAREPTTDAAGEAELDQATGQPETLGVDSGAEPEDTSGICPYQGLAPFGQERAAWFFGRARSTTALLRRLGDALRGGGFVMLVGASGAGKSSLIRAGLQPAIATERLGVAGSASWPVITMTPGQQPLRDLRARIPELVEGPVLSGGAIRSAIATHVRRARPEGVQSDNGRLVLVIDQFEELFTLCADEVQRRAFIRLLYSAATPGITGGPAPALVVLGMRADFYGRCLRYPELAHALQERQLVLGPMSRVELRDAVTCPAKAVGLGLEPGLVELMLRDLGAGQDGTARWEQYDAGALPLLSHALLATWQRRRSGRLTLAGYRASGGIQGAVAASGERAWAELDTAGQHAARRLLLRLVRIGTDTRDTRRRSTRAELLAAASDRAATEDALERLAKARLVTLDADSVEISHEALLHAWPRLRRWIDADRDEILARQRLHEDAQVWEGAGRDPSLLYHGARVDVARRVARGNAAELSPVARDFLRVSSGARQRAVWTRRAALAAVCVFALIASVAAGLAIRERDDARFRQLVAEADRAQQTDQTQAAWLDLTAHQLRPDDQGVRSRLLTTENMPLASQLRGHTGAVYLTSFSPDGKLLATASFDKTIRLWDVADPAHPTQLGGPLTGHTSWLTAAVFSPDGRTLASTGDDHTIRLWSVADPTHPRQLASVDGGHGTVYLLAFSPDGRTLAGADADHTVGRWNVTDPDNPAALPPLTGAGAAVRSLAFSPDGHTLASGGDDDAIRLWDMTAAQSSALGSPLTGHTGSVHSVAFSPDGHTLASGGDDKSVRLWNVADPAHASPLGPPLTEHSGAVWSVAFRPDGGALASASADGSVRLWNLADPRQPTPLGQPMAGRGGIVYAVAFSPDGKRLATGSDDGVVRLWSLPSGLLSGHRGSVQSSAYRPDGGVLATGGADGVIRLWDMRAAGGPRPLGPGLSAHDGPVFTLVFSPDGHTLASGGGDQVTRLWDVRDPARPRLATAPLTGSTGRPVAFRQDGRLLATANDYRVQLWDIHDVAHPTPVADFATAHAGYITQLLFTPDGHTLVSASFDRTVRLWNVTDPRHPVGWGAPLSRPAGPVWSIALRPDGRVLATADGDDTIALWDISRRARPVPLGPLRTGHTDALTAVAFTQHGDTLVSASHDKTIRLWNVAKPAKATTIGDPLTAASGAPLSLSVNPAGTMLATGNDDDTVQLWDLNVDHAIGRACSLTRDLTVSPDPRRTPAHVASAPSC